MIGYLPHEQEETEPPPPHGIPSFLPQHSCVNTFKTKSSYSVLKLAVAISNLI